MLKSSQLVKGTALKLFTVTADAVEAGIMARHSALHHAGWPDGAFDSVPHVQIGGRRAVFSQVPLDPDWAYNLRWVAKQVWLQEADVHANDSGQAVIRASSGRSSDQALVMVTANVSGNMMVIETQETNRARIKIIAEGSVYARAADWQNPVLLVRLDPGTALHLKSIKSRNGRPIWPTPKVISWQDGRLSMNQVGVPSWVRV